MLSRRSFPCVPFLLWPRLLAQRLGHMHRTYVTALVIALTIGHVSPSLGQEASGSSPITEPEVVEITATDYAFDAPDEIPSGWVTFRFTNEGEEPHFFVPLLLDEGWTFEDYEVDVVPLVNEMWIAHREGEMEQEEALEQGFELYEERELDIYEYRGGSGILATGLRTDVTLYMEPGRYVLECYVKTEDGEFHLMEGMMRELVVTDRSLEATQPEADIDITFADGEMVMDGDLRPGSLTFRVTTEQPEENVHIARMDGDADAQEVAEWMDWFAVDRFNHPAPATFVGGMHILPEGATGYFTADLEPGRYAFVRGFNFFDLSVLKEVTIEP